MLVWIRNLGSRLRQRLSVPSDIRAGSTRALLYVAWALLAIVPLVILATAPSIYNFLALLLAAALGVLGAALVWLGLRLIARISPRLLWALLLLMVVFLPFAWLGATLYVVLGWLALSLALLGGGLVAVRQQPGKWPGIAALSIGAFLMVAFLVGLLLDGWQAEEEIVWEPMQGPGLNLDDPAAPGSFSVSEYTYGPGNDPHRDEFGEGVTFVTEPVDGSKLLDGWEGASGWARTAFWDANAETLPVRGRIWLPEGEGPFPLVLIVHGNHAMEDFSDGGYAYLGALFASRGSVAASVDENFLNLSTSSLLGLFDGGLEEENDARGWMLLEHVRQFRDWSEDPEHLLNGRVDADRVVLIGHSRGGEAVSEAAVFNRLSHYPDDATLTFDYNFGIQGIIAIAPVDHQYHPRDFDTNMRDVNYLVIHGSHDSDVNSYAGYAAYSRLEYANCKDCFRAGFYAIGANHGQFNTSWGRYDVPAPFNRFLNVDPLMEGAAQRRVAQVLFSAFLEATVHDKPAYRQLVAAPGRQQALFGETARFLSHYRAADDYVVADYGEDADVATATSAGAVIRGSNLTLWREADLSLKWRSADNAMAQLGWQAPGARYDVSGISPLPGARVLSLAIGMSEQSPGDIEDYEAPDRIDFHVEIEDAAGHVSRLPISARRALLPQVKPVMYKLPGLDADAPSEVVMQRYRFALAEFEAQNPQLSAEALRRVSLVFDLTDAGTIWLDDLTLSSRLD